MVEKLMAGLKSKCGESILKLETADKRVTLTGKVEDHHRILSELKSMGFEHLSDVTGVDYLADGEFELVYHLWSHSQKARSILKIRINRESPAIGSVIDLWPGAQIHEREIHELFGIHFEGNPDLSPLFLEDWAEIPPFRKDFDTREYVRRKYFAGK